MHYNYDRCSFVMPWTIMTREIKASMHLRNREQARYVGLWALTMYHHQLVEDIFCRSDQSP
jgi:hypothetical protein